jgi:NADH:ubiquinone reductase (H+-translocating)
MGARILIVGGGYVGMYTALRLEKRLGREHTITLVTPENFMLYQPFLPEVAGGTIDPRAVVVPLRRVLKRTDLTIGEVERIDHERKVAHVRLAGDERREIAYDHVVIGAGSWSRVLPIPGLAEHAVGFKTVSEAIYLRNRVLSQLDKADELRDPKARFAALTFVFVGAGYAGVEALGELEDLAREALELYPALTEHDMRWMMIEARDAILPELGPSLARYARDRLEERGIEVRTSTRLESIEKGIVRLSGGEEFAAETVVWTAGVKPSPLPRRSGLPTDEAGRLRVDPFLRVVDTPGAWGAGDVAAVPDEATHGLAPPTAQHALRQARRLAENLAATLAGRTELRPFRWKHKGSVASLGHYKGVANPLGVRVRGFPAWFLHRTYHLLYMPTWGRRVRIALDWTVALLFPRDIAQLGSLERPKESFARSFE